MVGGNELEAVLDILVFDRIEGTGAPVAEIALHFVAVKLVGALRASGSGPHVGLKGGRERRHGEGFGARLLRIVAASGAFDDLAGALPGVAACAAPGLSTAFSALEKRPFLPICKLIADNGKLSGRGQHTGTP